MGRGWAGFNPRCTGMNKHDTDALALSLSQDRPEPSPDPDPENPIADPHETHDWVLRMGFAECSVCAMRDHYRGAGEPCSLAPEPEGVTLETAADRLFEELRAFVAHMLRIGITSRPSMNDWRSEAFEHARDRKAKSKRRS